MKNNSMLLGNIVRRLSTVLILVLGCEFFNQPTAAD
jgi:hypothetical protein